MNRIILCLFLAFPAISRAQSPMFGLYSPHYLQANNVNDKIHLVNKPAAIIYDQSYCWLYSQNGDIVAFQTRSYTKTVNTSTKSIHESFVNQESQTTVDAFYHILVDQTNEGWTFQISTPTGTIICEKAQRFGENGKVPGMKIDWIAVKAGERRAESVQAAGRRRDSLRQDSLRAENLHDIQYHDSLIQVAKGLHIFFRDDPPNSWLLAMIKSKSQQP